MKVALKIISTVLPFTDREKTRHRDVRTVQRQQDTRGVSTFAHCKTGSVPPYTQNFFGTYTCVYWTLCMMHVQISMVCVHESDEWVHGDVLPARLPPNHRHQTLPHRHTDTDTFPKQIKKESDRTYAYTNEFRSNICISLSPNQYLYT
jgi:hypothetical protein